MPGAFLFGSSESSLVNNYPTLNAKDFVEIRCAPAFTNCRQINAIPATGKHASQALQFLHQYIVVGNTLLNKTHEPVSINDVGHAAATQEVPDLVILVGQQGKTDVVLPREFAMSLKAVTTDAQDLGITLFKALDITLKSL
jgi:hypothetical protein